MNELKPKGREPVRWIQAIVRAYFIFALTVWLLLYVAGDRWWPATLILFGPRWFLSLPLLILVPLAVWRERRQLILLLIAFAVLFVPVMGLRMPLTWKPPKGPTIRILTCNTGGAGLDTGKLRRLIDQSAVGIVALQECPEETMHKVLSGWNCLNEGNLVVASRYPIEPGRSRQAMHPPHKWPRFSLLQCRIQLPERNLTFCSVHLPSPRYGLANILDRKMGLNPFRVETLSEEQDLRRKTSQEISGLIRMEPLPVIIAGDFNMPVESVWYRKFWAEYSNAFSRAGFGFGFTEKVEIKGFEYGVRIDHILAKGGLIASRCRVGPDVGSDHLPVIAEFQLKIGDAPGI